MCMCHLQMDRFWIIALTLFVSIWESAAITNKGYSLHRKDFLRNNNYFEAAGSSSVDIDWEVGLREAVSQSLLREKYHEHNLRDRLLDAPLIGKQAVITPFGDIVILARGQLYITRGENFLFVLDGHQHDCDPCYNRNHGCVRRPCEVWYPDENEHLVALWTVKRIRHRSPNGYYYELEYTVSPISPSIREYITRNGRFDYSIPGHVFVVKYDSPSQHEAQYNRHIPYVYLKPEIITGPRHNEAKHDYPGLYTLTPIRPSFHQNRYHTNDQKQIELYKELIESLASKTSRIQNVQTSPTGNAIFSMENSVTLPTKKVTPLTKITSVAGSTTMASSPTYNSIQFPYPNNKEPIITKPSIMNIFPTNPTTITQAVSVNKGHAAGVDNSETIPPVLTTIHYFTPIEDLPDITKSKGATSKKPIQPKPQDEADFLFPLQTTLPSKTTQKYNKATIVTEESNFLQEPTSFVQTTKQYYTTTTKMKPESLPTTLKSIPRPTTAATIISKYTTKTPKLNITRTRPIANNKKNLTTFSTPKLSKPTYQTFKQTDSKIVTTKASTKSSTQADTTKTTNKTLYEFTEVTTEKMSTTSKLKLETTKTKQSNLTGFIAATSVSKVPDKITTYKPKPTVIKLPTKSTSVKEMVPETTTSSLQTLSTRKIIQHQSTVSKPFKRPSKPHTPTINAENSLLEGIPSTETISQKESDGPSSNEANFSSTVIPQTTALRTTESKKTTLNTVATTKAKNPSQKLPSYTTIPTTEMYNVNQTSTVIQESFTPKRESDTITSTVTTTTYDTYTYNLPILNTETTETLNPTTASSFGKESGIDKNKYENDHTMLTTSFPLSKPIPSVSSTRTPTTHKIKPVASMLDDFLTEDGNGKEHNTIFDNTDVDEDDIFGAVKIQDDAKNTPTIQNITESELANELFGSRNSKSLKHKATIPEETTIIYSNFFEASTTLLPPTTEYKNQKETYDATTDTTPLTSQSYSTSISMIKNNKIENSKLSSQSITATTSAPSTVRRRENLDHLALQLINHVKSIDILSGNSTESSNGNNGTNRKKYKRRRTYIASNRKTNKTQVSQK